MGIALLAAIAVVLIFAFLTAAICRPDWGISRIPQSANLEHELESRVAELGKIVEERVTPLEQGKATADEALPILADALLDLHQRLAAIERKETRHRIEAPRRGGLCVQTPAARQP